MKLSKKIYIHLQCPPGTSSFKKAFRNNEVESKLCSRILSLTRTFNWPLLDYKINYSTFDSENTYKMIYSSEDTEYTVNIEFILNESDHWDLDKIVLSTGETFTDFFDAEEEIQNAVVRELVQLGRRND